MQVLLDGLPITIARPTLADALAAATASAQERGRIIIEVKADGVAVPDDKLGNPSTDPSDIKELRLTSADPRLLVQQTILDAAEALDTARSQQSQASDMIQGGRPEEALNLLQVVLVTWQAVRDVVARSAEVLHIRLDTLALPGVDEGVTFPSATEELLTHLRAMHKALDQQDWSALSDILAYDLDAQSQTWRALLVALADYTAKLPPQKAGRP